MKFSVALATLVSLVPAAFGLTINTPVNVVQCQPVLLSWADGTAPYFLSLLPAGQTSGTALMTFPTQQGTSLTWTVNLQANTGFTIALKDSTGNTAYSDIVTVQAGSDSSCLNSTSTIISSGPGTNTGASSPTNTATGNTANSSGGSGSSTRTSTSPSSTSSSSGNTGDAAGLALSSFGVAGVLGAVAVLF